MATDKDQEKADKERKEAELANAQARVYALAQEDDARAGDHLALRDIARVIIDAVPEVGAESEKAQQEADKAREKADKEAEGQPAAPSWESNVGEPPEGPSALTGPQREADDADDDETPKADTEKAKADPGKQAARR